MKMIFIVMFLAGCASTNYGGIVTGSRIYDARFAAEHGATQAKVTQCEQEARVLWSQKVALHEWGFANNIAGLAFEKCVSEKHAS